MFGWFTRKTASPSLPLYFHNTLGNKREEFKPRGSTVKMYNCGPTVYDKQQIGNLSAAVFADTIRRVLEYNGYRVKQVINITDFGHLVSDADEGEDKMTKGLKREGLPVTMESMQTLAEKYTAQYLHDIEALGVVVQKIEFPRASNYIEAQIAIIKTLDEKGYAYQTKDGLYFDTGKFKDYGALGGIDAEQMIVGARVHANSEKHSPADFVLWKKDSGMGWESPWGKGFPGWHIECSAMARALLGEQIDIHTGGIEHIPIHHNNEIAQTEAATGKHPFARFWLHRAHIQIDGRKISKSLGNTVYLSDVIERGFQPLALRYWFQTAHYRAHANFTWEALEGAATAFSRLGKLCVEFPEAASAIPAKWKQKFHERINDDLDTPGAIAVMWDMLRDEKLSPAERKAALLDFDRVLGLSLAEAAPPIAVSDEVQRLVDEREKARAEKNWSRADELRAAIKAKGFIVEDTPGGPKLTAAPPQN